MNAGNLISANRLQDGLVVWLDKQHNWVDDLAQAHVFDAQELEPAQAAAKSALAANLIVDPMPRPAQLSDAGPVPEDFREQLRSRGPSDAKIWASRPSRAVSRRRWRMRRH